MFFMCCIVIFIVQCCQSEKQEVSSPAAQMQYNSSDSLLQLTVDVHTMKKNFLDLYGSIRAHDRTLSALVSQRLNIPRFVCLLPLEHELKDWCSNPTTMLFSNTATLVVICPVTLKVVPRGDDGERNLPSNISDTE